MPSNMWPVMTDCTVNSQWAPIPTDHSSHAFGFFYTPFITTTVSLLTQRITRIRDKPNTFAGGGGGLTLKKAIPTLKFPKLT